MEKRKILLQVDKLKVNFNTYQGRVEAIRSCSFKVYENEMLAIVGESGSGKSVVTQAILRLLPTPPAEISGGQVLYRGVDLLQASEQEMQKIRGNKIGIIFQDAMTALNPTMKIGKQITETIIQHKEETLLEAKSALAFCEEKLKDLSKSQDAELYAFYENRARIAKDYLDNPKTPEERALELLQLVRIPSPEKRMKQYIHQFSGGMRQRIMIAIALACNPVLLIADEPTTALDVTIKAEILDILADLKKRFGTSIILITHDLGVVASKADRVCVMYCGEIVESASCEEIFKNPQHPYTKGLLQSIPRLDKKTEERLDIISGSTPNPYNLPKGCAFAPRCKYAMKVCEQYAPPKSLKGEKHRYYCWLADERARKNKDEVNLNEK
jgi:oligopeptide/dipeptide ABC transporter ATP-binding protein